MKTIWENHKDFIKTVYYIAYGIGYLMGLFDWLRALLASIQEGNFVSFLLALVFQFIFTFFSAFLIAIVWGTIGVIVLFIPYLVIRGFIKK